ncbi:MAG: tetratricopeptide repeat protein [Melioribacteraceae bacterium]|nr:tetratricopeptide repeat protein [Melioribacteraceae bacterium]
MIKKVIFILLLPTLLLFAQTNLSNKYRLGKTYEQSGKLEKAKVIFEELALVQPQNNQYANSLNDIYLKLKEYDKSAKFLLNRIKMRNNDVTLYGMLGATYYISGNSEQAVETWDKGILLNNNSQINYTIISNYAMQNRAFEIAVKYLEEGKSKSTNSIQFSYQLAQIYSYTMNYGAAAEEYCAALMMQPTQLSYVQSRMSTYLSAVGALEQSINVVEKYDDNITIKELLSFLYVKNNQFVDAFELTKELDKAKGGEGILIYNFASNAFRESQFDVASNAFRYLIDEYPHSKFVPQSSVGFAKTLEAKLDKEWNKNQQNWKPIVAIDTANSYKYIPIIKTYKSIISSASGNIASEALFRIGNIYADKFMDYENAAEYFNKTIKSSSLSPYYGKANLELSKISLRLNKLEKAKKELYNVYASSKTGNRVKMEAKFLIAKIEFYQTNFEGSLATLANINKDLSNDLSNDAIELSMIINMGKMDSLSLQSFADAELKIDQYKFQEAEIKLKELSEKKNLLFLKNISRIKYAEVLVAQNKYPVAIEVLKELSERKELNIFADRSFYLLAQVYEFGVGDVGSAESVYQKFLKLFPNSLYLDKAQENLKRLKNKGSESI